MLSMQKQVCFNLSFKIWRLIKMTPKQAISFFGGRSELAKALGISYQSVQQWDEANKIPKGRQFEIQVITNGQLKTEAAA